MTRRSEALNALEPDPIACINPTDLRKLGLLPGDALTVASRRGEVTLHARADEGTPVGAIFIPFCYYEAAANTLTNPVLDPFGKIPEFKYCAVKVTPGGELVKPTGYGKAPLAPAPEVA
jgi:formate dehydrogenase major subunit